MGKLTEIKEILSLNEVRKIEPTEIMLSEFNFSTGLCMKYKFLVHYVGKIPYGFSAQPKDYANHVVNVYGIITYDNGCSYKHTYKLTYTDDSELEKLIVPIKEGVSGSYQIFADQLRLY